MAEDGIVGQYNGSQAREVLISLEDWEAMTRAANEDGEAAAATGTAAGVAVVQAQRPAAAQGPP